MKNKTRRLLKYSTDVLINPSKSIALVFKPVEFVVTGCVIFGIAEFLHCVAHLNGAWNKYKSGKKPVGWMVAKVAIIMGRLIASLTGAVALSLFAIMASSTLASTLFAPLYAIGFMASTVFSTLHKVRGLFDHCTKQRTIDVTDEQYKSKRNGLITRAFVGLAGTALSVAVLLKVAFVMVLIANPATFWSGVGIFVVMALYKAKNACKEYNHPKHPEESISLIEESGSASSLAGLGAGLTSNTSNSKNVSSPSVSGQSLEASGDGNREKAFFDKPNSLVPSQRGLAWKFECRVS